MMSFFALANSQAQIQTVTLTANGNVSVTTNSYALSTNQIIRINSFITDLSQDTVASIAGRAVIFFKDGNKMSFYPNSYGLNYKSTGGVAFAENAIFLGATNIQVIGYYNVVLTFTITTPTTETTVPVNTVVIPTDATGPVQIVLESSGDLINWNASLPGTYGNTYSNRFFRVRAIAQ